MGSRSKHGYLDPTNNGPAPKFRCPLRKLPEHEIKRTLVKMAKRRRRNRDGRTNGM
jgi:hypothetical protein